MGRRYGPRNANAAVDLVAENMTVKYKDAGGRGGIGCCRTSGTKRSCEVEVQNDGDVIDRMRASGQILLRLTVLGSRVEEHPTSCCFSCNAPVVFLCQTPLTWNHTVFFGNVRFSSSILWVHHRTMLPRYLLLVVTDWAKMEKMAEMELFRFFWTLRATIFSSNW